MNKIAFSSFRIKSEGFSHKMLSKLKFRTEFPDETAITIIKKVIHLLKIETRYFFLNHFNCHIRRLQHFMLKKKHVNVSENLRCLAKKKERSLEICFKSSTAVSAFL